MQVEHGAGLDEVLRELLVPELRSELFPVRGGQLDLRLMAQVDSQAVYVPDVEPVGAVARLQVLAEPPVEAGEENPETLAGQPASVCDCQHRLARPGTADEHHAVVAAHPAERLRLLLS